MFCELIINGMPEIIKFFQELKLEKNFSKPQRKHLQGFLIAMMLYGYHGKITNVSELAHNAYRTSVGRFLNNSKWDEAYLLKQLQTHVIERIWAKAKESNLPINIIIDDTICEKTVPSSKVKRPIAGCGFHQSHLLNKTVYGHQFVTVMLRCGDLVLPYNTILYKKGKDSKIQIAKKVIESLPRPVTKGYVLTDSWYSCQELFETALKGGYHYIAALKSNRKVYPRGYRKIGIQVGEFARTLKLSDFDMVTIKGNSYYVYTYLGKINGLHKVKIVISWPLKAMFVPRAMKVFLSTDFHMSAKKMLLHYTNRWPIEVFFREANRRLGMKHCQVHTLSGVIRFQYIIMLCHIFCGLEVQGETLGFSKQRNNYQKLIQKFHLSWIYSQAQGMTPLDTVLKEFDLA